MGKQMTAGFDKEKLWSRSLIFIILTNTCSSISFQILAPTLPIFVEDLGYTQTIVGLVAGIITFTAIILRPFIGQAIDKWNRKNLFYIGMTIIVFSIFSYQFAETMTSLLILRLIHGVGWGIVTTVTVTIATDIIPKSRLGEGLGYYGLSSVTAIALAPAIGLQLYELFGYKILFIIAAGIAGLGLLFGVFVKMRKTNRQNTIPIENQGFKIGTFFEKQAIKPSQVNFFMMLTLSSIFTFIALYAAARGVDHIGIFFTVFAITLFISRPISGKIVDRKGFESVIIPGLIIVGVALFVLHFATSLPYFIFSAILYGIGYGSVQPSLQALSVYNVPPHRRGAANSTFLISSDLAFGFGSILWGFVASTWGYDYFYLCVLISVVLSLIVYIRTMLKERRIKGAE